MRRELSTVSPVPKHNNQQQGPPHGQTNTLVEQAIWALTRSKPPFLPVMLLAVLASGQGSVYFASFSRGLRGDAVIHLHVGETDPPWAIAVALHVKYLVQTSS